MLILHGEDQTKSRAELNQIKKKSAEAEVINLDGKTATLTEVIYALEAGSLFVGGRLVVIEGLLSSTSSKRREEILAYLKEGEFTFLILWEGKEISAATLKKLKAEVKVFKISPVIFALLESQAPRQTKNMLLRFEEAVKQDAVELVFYMMGRQVRQMIQALDGSYKGPDWLRSKLARQAGLFGQEKLLAFHRALYGVDKAVKTGKSNLELTAEVEILLLGL